MKENVTSIWKESSFVTIEAVKSPSSMCALTCEFVSPNTRPWKNSLFSGEYNTRRRVKLSYFSWTMNSTQTSKNRFFSSITIHCIRLEIVMQYSFTWVQDQTKIFPKSRKGKFFYYVVGMIALSNSTFDNWVTKLRRV